MPELQYGIHNPPLPLLETTGRLFSDIPWSAANIAPLGPNPPFQSEEDFDLGFQGHIANSSGRLVHDQAPDNTSLMSHNSLQIAKSFPSDEFESRTLAARAKARQMKELPDMNTDPAIASLEIIITNPKEIMEERPRKDGRRHGPLKPEQRENASLMRKKTACLSCWFKKVNVSWI
jgi:hypothetical protein